MNDRITIRIRADIKEALNRFHREQVPPMTSKQDAYRHIIEDWLIGHGYLPIPPSAQGGRGPTADMKPLHQFNAAEADRWIMEMRRSLAEHADRLHGRQHPGEVRAAMDTHVMLLREMASVHPDKREKIEALISHYERA